MRSRTWAGVGLLLGLAGAARGAPSEAERERAERHVFLARMLLSRDAEERTWGAVALRQLPAEQAGALSPVLAAEVLRTTGALRAPEPDPQAPCHDLVHLELRWFRSAYLEDETSNWEVESRSLRGVSEPTSGWVQGAPGRVAPLDDTQSEVLIRLAEKGAMESRLAARREVRVGEVVRYAEQEPTRVAWGPGAQDLAEIPLGFTCEVEVLRGAKPGFLLLRLRALSLQPATPRAAAPGPTLRPAHDSVLDLGVGALDLPAFALPDRGALLAQTCSIADGSPRRGAWLVYVCAERVEPGEGPTPR